MDRCTQAQKDFGHEHEQMKEMIRRFDELLSDKLNIITFTGFQRDVIATYMPKEMLNHQFDQVQARFDNLLGRVTHGLKEQKEVQTAIDNQINTQCGSLVAMYMRKYEAIE